MSELVTAIVTGVALGSFVGLVGYRWGWQAGVGAAILMVVVSLAVVLTESAAMMTVTLALLAGAAVSGSIAQIGGRRHAA